MQHGHPSLRHSSKIKGASLGRQGGGEARSTGEAGECLRREVALVRERRKEGDRDPGDWREPTNTDYGSEIPDSVACVMWSPESCGVGWRSPCRATLSADSTPHNPCMDPARARPLGRGRKPNRRLVESGTVRLSRARLHAPKHSCARIGWPGCSRDCSPHGGEGHGFGWLIDGMCMRPPVSCRRPRSCIRGCPRNAASGAGQGFRS